MSHPTAGRRATHLLAPALPLALFLLATFAAGALGSAFTFAALRDWYPTLAKPSWTPAGSTIGLVWTVLYAVMGVAAWLVWRRGGWRGQRVALSLFAAQLALNVGWSAAFFGLRSPVAGLVEIVVLLVAVAATLVAFWRASRAAGALMVPYLAWVGFATYLTYAIWRLHA